MNQKMLVQIPGQPPAFMMSRLTMGLAVILQVLIPVRMDLQMEIVQVQ